MKDIQEIKECPDCASTNLVYDNKEQQVICQDCGLIYEPLAPGIDKKNRKVKHLKRKAR